MNDERRKNTPEEVAEIYKAATEGRQIEFRFLNGSNQWEISRGYLNLNFHFGENQYRIKPEPPKPRVIYVNDYGGGFAGNAISESPADAKDIRGFGTGRTVCFIEDLNWKEGDPE